MDEGYDIANQAADSQGGTQGAARQLGDELADRQSVLVLDLVEEGKGVGLHHLVGGVDGFLHLIHPGGGKEGGREGRRVGGRVSGE